jgi:uncharacterized protein (TIGR02302 family)
MPISLPRTAFPSGWRDPLQRRIGAARLVLAVEKVLPRLWPAAGFAGFYLSLALTGLFDFTPWPVQALFLAATITASALSLADGFADFIWPRGIDAERRLERDNGLAHRPVSERDDRLVNRDPFAAALWNLHRQRGLPGSLRIRPPRLSIAARDPYGLRWYLLIAVTVGLVMARGETWPRLVRAFDSGAGAAASLDAWIDPPPYTGLPLTSLHIGDDSVITVPQGSVLNLRVHGAARTPGLMAGSNRTPRFAGEDGEYSSNVILTAPARVRVQVGGHAIGKWTINAAPDLAPTITLTAKPSATEQKATRFTFKGRDDYGIAKVRAVLVPRHGKPLVVDLPLPQTDAKELAQDSYVDLTSHPYAGLTVTAHLEAEDALKQVGVSQAMTFQLPARVFTDPLARALVEQRQNLANGEDRKLVLIALDAFGIDPDRFYDGKKDIAVDIKSAHDLLQKSRTDAEVSKVEEILWQTALKLERGGLLSAAEELRKLAMQLAQAMASGAPQEVIDELLKRYNDAMQRYVQALQANPDMADKSQPPPDAKELGMNDVQSILKMIRELNKAGDRQQAAQLLAMLQSMLENMHMSRNGQGGDGQTAQDKANNEKLQKFSDLMNKQRQLLDKTFRQKQGQGDPKDGGAQGLQKQQQELQKQLQDSLKGMDGKSADKLRDAGKAMGEAQNSLGQKDLDNAGSAQNQAMEAMREGAQSLAKQAQGGQQMGGQDPLGRGQSQLGQSGVKIPGATDLAKARQILEELRRRAAQMNRPQQERDYLDRLLKSF